MINQMSRGSTVVVAWSLAFVQSEVAVASPARQLHPPAPPGIVTNDTFQVNSSTAAAGNVAAAVAVVSCECRISTAENI